MKPDPQKALKYIAIILTYQFCLSMSAVIYGMYKLDISFIVTGVACWTVVAVLVVLKIIIQTRNEK